MRSNPGEPSDFRPLLAGGVRWDDQGVAIELGRSEVRVDGPPDRLRAILEDCDGRTSLEMIARRHGDQSLALLTRLRTDGGVVDGEQAWRILHRQGSTGAPLGRPIDGIELKRLVETTYIPDLPDSATFELEPEPTRTATLARTRRSTRPGDDVRVTFSGLSSLLAAAYGISPSDSGTVPSAGGLYPLIVHVLIREELPPASPGLWWHDPRTLKLHRQKTRVADNATVFAPGVVEPGILGRRMPIIFFSADLRRPSRKYGPRGYRYALMEAGAAMQCAHLAAAEVGVPLRAIGGIEDDSLRTYLALPDGAVPLLAMLAGA